MNDLGEFDLIAKLAERLERPRQGLGIGDDAAAWQPTPGRSLVATTDMLVEGIHFRLDWTTPRDLGWKALAVNLSDLAAMGATPTRGLVAVGMRRDQGELVGELYEGLNELARETGTLIVGGDIVRTPGPLILNVAIFGEAEPDRLLRRDCARPGDLLAVTGIVGASAAGLELLQRGDERLLTDRRAARLLSAHHRPSPRLEAGEALARVGVSCAIDVSDGVASEAWHIAESSGVEIELNADLLPLAPEAVALLGPNPARRLALSGGEDYELLFCVPEGRLVEVAPSLPSDAKPTVVGRVLRHLPGGHLTLLESDRALEEIPTGYAAF